MPEKWIFCHFIIEIINCHTISHSMVSPICQALDRCSNQNRHNRPLSKVTGLPRSAHFFLDNNTGRLSDYDCSGAILFGKGLS